MWLAAAGLLLVCATGELLHWLRVRRAVYLAFGSSRRPLRFAAAAAVLRVLAVTALGWGLVALLLVKPAPWYGDLAEDELSTAPHHLVLALDVSPSMQIDDAGPQGNQTRAERARELLRSIVDRLDMRRMRTTVVAFYTDAKPVVVDTYDPVVLLNILNDLPVEHAFHRGKTNMYSAVHTSSEVGKTWQPQSATLVLCSDGDTLPPEETPRLPVAFDDVLVLGVGNPFSGQFIDGHSSRQDTESLNRLALKLGGVYDDGNQRHVASDRLASLFAPADDADSREPFQLRDAAIWAVVVGASVLALLSPALALVGSLNELSRKRRDRFGYHVRPTKASSTAI